MTIVIHIPDGGVLKRDILEMAFEDCRLAGYEFERSPEEVASALRKLNALMAEWKAHQGIDLGYAQPAYGAGDASDASGIPQSAMNAVASYLALRIAPQMGKALAPEAKANLARAFSLLQAEHASVPSMPMGRNTPRGSGYPGQNVPYINEHR